MKIDYFTKVLEDNLKAVVKPQYVDQIPRAVKGPIQGVKDLIKARVQLDNMKEIMDVLGMEAQRLRFRRSPLMNLKI
jgi:ATP-binding cassette subfamily E protein 1